MQRKKRNGFQNIIALFFIKRDIYLESLIISTQRFAFVWIPAMPGTPISIQL